MLRFLTAGESHGKALVTIVEGVPAGLALDLDAQLQGHDLVPRQDGGMAVNYGLNRVRFLAPVPAGSRIRLRSDLIDAQKVDDTTVDLTVRHTVELEGSDKPAAVAELIARMIF